MSVKNPITTPLPTFVQGKSVNFGSGVTGGTAAFASPNTAGNLLWVGCNYAGTTGGVPTCMDSAGNNYKLLHVSNNYANSSSYNMGGFYAYPAAAGPTPSR